MLRYLYHQTTITGHTSTHRTIDFCIPDRALDPGDPTRLMLGESAPTRAVGAAA